MSFKEDIREIFSLNKIFAFLIAIGVIIATAEDKLNAGLSFSFVIIVGLIIVFIFKWIFVYRGEKNILRYKPTLYGVKRKEEPLNAIKELLKS